jgi:hypothetical protein
MSINLIKIFIKNTIICSIHQLSCGHVLCFLRLLYLEEFLLFVNRIYDVDLWLLFLFHTNLLIYALDSDFGFTLVDSFMISEF